MTVASLVSHSVGSSLTAWLTVRRMWNSTLRFVVPRTLTSCTKKCADCVGEMDAVTARGLAVGGTRCGERWERREVVMREGRVWRREVEVEVGEVGELETTSTVVLRSIVCVYVCVCVCDRWRGAWKRVRVSNRGRRRDDIQSDLLQSTRRATNAAK